LWEEELSPYPSDTELETILVQSMGSNFVTISGLGLNSGFFWASGSFKAIRQ